MTGADPSSAVSTSGAKRDDYKIRAAGLGHIPQHFPHLTPFQPTYAAADPGDGKAPTPSVLDVVECCCDTGSNRP